MAVATATPWPAVRSSRPRWEMGLGGENGGGEHRRGSGGSQRWRWDARRGRGRPGADEFVDGDRRVRRGEERRGGASGLLRSREMAGRVRMEWRSWWASWGSEGGPVAAVVASGGDGGSVRGGKQRRGEERSGKREGAAREEEERGDTRPRRGVAREAGGRRRWPGHRQRSPPSSFGARGGRRQEKGGQVGWAAQVGCTVLGCGWAAR